MVEWLLDLSFAELKSWNLCTKVKVEEAIRGNVAGYETETWTARNTCFGVLFIGKDDNHLHCKNHSKTCNLGQREGELFYSSS